MRCSTSRFRAGPASSPRARAARTGFSEQMLYPRHRIDLSARDLRVAAAALARGGDADELAARIEALPLPSRGEGRGEGAERPSASSVGNRRSLSPLTL